MVALFLFASALVLGVLYATQFKKRAAMEARVLYLEAQREKAKPSEIEKEEDSTVASEDGASPGESSGRESIEDLRSELTSARDELERVRQRADEDRAEKERVIGALAVEARRNQELLETISELDQRLKALQAETKEGDDRHGK